MAEYVYRQRRKKSDGTYDYFYPQTKSLGGVTFDEHLEEYATYDFQQFDKDVTTGMYFRFEEYRPDSTLFRKTVLSNPDANGYPQTETQTRYDTDGTTVLSTKTFTLIFDADGLLTQRDEVV